jgi:hypothetical protein
VTVKTGVTRWQKLNTELTLVHMREGQFLEFMVSFPLSTVEYFLNTS